MAGVAFVFVREDASDAETLAEAFDAAGYSITGADDPGAALSVILWSRAPLRSDAFRTAAERALRTNTVIVASLTAPPEAARVLGAMIVDLSAWDGEDDAGLEKLIAAAKCGHAPGASARNRAAGIQLCGRRVHRGVAAER